MDQSTYNTSYMASLPPQIITTMAIPAINAIEISNRLDQFISLAKQGMIIDDVIHVQLQDPYNTMMLRAQYGYTWVPSLLMPNVQAAPGESYPGIIPYNATNPPAGAVIVYWPNPPAPLTPVIPIASTNGLTLGASFTPQFPGYYAMNGDSTSIAAGTTVELNGHRYVKQAISRTLFGIMYGWFELN